MLHPSSPGAGECWTQKAVGRKAEEDFDDDMAELLDDLDRSRREREIGRLHPHLLLLLVHTHTF